MKRSFNFFLCFFTFISGVFMCQAQKSYTIQFDQTGKIIDGLPENLKPGDSIYFRVLGDVPTSLAETLKLKIQDVKNYGERIKDNTFLKNTYTDFLGIDNSAFMDYQLPLSRDGYPSPIDTTGKVTAYKIKIFDLTCTTCGSAVNASYDICTTRLFVKKNGLEVDVKDNTGKYSPSGKGIPLGPNNKIEFSLLKDDRYKEFVFKYFSLCIKDTADINKLNATKNIIKVLNKQAIKLVGNIDSVKKLLVDTESNLLLKDTVRFAKDINVALQLIISAENIDNEYHLLLPIAHQWVYDWLWYTGGIPKFNPFPFISPGDFKEPDTSDLPALRFLLAKYQEEFTAPHKYNNIFDSINKITKRINRIKNSFLRYKQDIKKNDSIMKDFSVTEYILNNFFFYDSSSFWMRNHDASNKEKWLNPAGKQEYDESNRIMILSHNLKKNQTVNITISVTPFVEYSSIDEGPNGLPNPLGQVAFLKSTNGKSSWESKQSSKETKSSLLKKQEEQLAKLRQAILDNINNLSKERRQLSDTIKEADYILDSNNHGFYKPNLNIKSTKDNTPLYHTEVANDGGNLKGPNKVTYTFDTTSVPTAKVSLKDTTKIKNGSPTGGVTFTYQVNKLYRILPFIGYAFVPSQIYTLQLNSTGTAPANLTISRTSIAYAGLKIELGKRGENIRSDKAIWKFSLDGGFSIPISAKEYFLGVGCDIVPGVCVNAGVMIYPYQWYDFLNSQYVVDYNTYRPGFYFGVSTDPAFVAEVAKLLNLTK